MNRPHAMVIGGTRGVGLELAGRFAKLGHAVTAIGRTPREAFDESTDFVAGDVFEPEALLRTLLCQVEKRGRLASLVFLQRFRGSSDPWAGEIAVTLTATKTVIDGLASHFNPDGPRAICLVGSNASSFVARNQSLAYHAAKAALVQMARYYAVQLGSRGIRVNVVSPSAFVKRESTTYYSQQTELVQLYEKITPLGRMGSAADVVNAIAFLSSAEASFITGQELVVDGGMSLVMQDSLARDVAGIGG